MIELLAPYRIAYSEEHINRIFELLRSEPFRTGMIGDAALCRRLESMLMEKYSRGCSDVYAVQSCTAALTLALRLINVADAHVLIQGNTFCAAVLAALDAHCGSVDFVDINRDTLGVSMESLAKAVAKRKPKALIVADMGGFVNPNGDEVAEYCKNNGIALVVDAAHSIGRDASYGDYICYSFGRIKLVGGGQGGALLVRNGTDFLRKKIRCMIEWGKMGHGMVFYGGSWMLSEFNAAAAVAALEALPGEVSKRKEIYRLYAEALGKSGSKLFLQEEGSSDNCCHYGGPGSLYKIYLRPPSDGTFDQAKFYWDMAHEEGVTLPAPVESIPLRKQHLVKSLFPQVSETPNVDWWCSNHAVLPAYSAMSEDDVFFFISALKSVLQEL